MPGPNGLRITSQEKAMTRVLMLAHHLGRYQLFLLHLPLPLHDQLNYAMPRSAFAQGGTTHEELSLGSVEDGKGMRKKRRCNDSDASEYERPPPETS